MISELALSNDVDVLSNVEQSSNIPNIRNYYHQPCSRRRIKWYYRYLRRFSNLSIFDSWSKNAVKLIDKDYDVVLSMTASTRLITVVVGKNISKLLGCKFAIYTVDAIPAPGGWIPKVKTYKRILRVVRHTFPAADYLAASNRHMLEYQVNTIKDLCKKEVVTDVLLTPSPSQSFIYPTSTQENIFLFTGAFYGLRRADHFLYAFKRLLRVYPDAKFLIVGNNGELESVHKILTAEEREHVQMYKHTADLDYYFSRAKVLVDIDADLYKDPFLAGKMATYIKVNRVILSETGLITPSHEMFAGLNTIIQCDHNEDSIYEGMLKAIEIANSNPDFSERASIVERFSTERVVEVLQDGLNRICNTKK